jgi:hypothetical protein
MTSPKNFLIEDRGLLVLAVDVPEPDQTVKKYLAEHPGSVAIVLTEGYESRSDVQRAELSDRCGGGPRRNIAGKQRGAAGERGLRRLLKRAGIEAKAETE